MASRCGGGKNEKRRDEPAREQTKKKSLSMHEGISVSCDCCSCEMEPYWEDVAKEMGIEYSDYETPEESGR